MAVNTPCWQPPEEHRSLGLLLALCAAASDTGRRAGERRVKFLQAAASPAAPNQAPLLSKRRFAYASSWSPTTSLPPLLFVLIFGWCLAKTGRDSERKPWGR